MRARWRIAVNGLLRGTRWRNVTLAMVGLALLVMALGAMVFSWFLTRGIVELTNRPEAAEVVPSSVLSAGLILSIMVSFTVALAALYLSADLDLLLASPVPRRAVFTSKLLGGLLPTYLIVVVLTLVPLAGHGLAMGYGPPYAAAVVLAMVLMPLIPMGVGGIAVMVIVRKVSAHRLGEVVGLIVAAMTLSLALVAGSARELREVLTLRDLLGVLERYRSPVSPAEWLASAVSAAGRGAYAESAGWFGLTVAISAAFVIPLFLVADRMYYDGWEHMQSADRRREAKSGRLPWNRVDRAFELSRPTGLLGRLPRPVVAVIRKDFRVIPRDLTNMAQVLSPLAIGLFFVLQQLLYPQAVGSADFVQPMIAPMLAMLSAALAAGVSAMVTARFGLTAFSSEGRSYWVLKNSPISSRQVIAAKFLVGYLPYLASSAVLVVLLEGARAWANARTGVVPTADALASGLHIGLIGYGWFVVSVLGFGALSITLALGAARPNLTWDTPHEMLTPDLGCLSLVFYGSYIAVAGFALAVPVAASGFPVIGHLSLLWAGGLGIGVGVTALVAAGAWRLANLEIAGIGE